MTLNPAMRIQQEEFIKLDTLDGYVLVTLPDGRTAQVYGNGTLKVTVATNSHFYRLPNTEDTIVPAPTATKRPVALRRRRS